LTGTSERQEWIKEVTFATALAVGLFVLCGYYVFVYRRVRAALREVLDRTTDPS
jgi:hypothetical protein